MLLYYLFWMFNGLYYALLYFFRTNLLTGGRVQIVFFAYFSVSQKRNIKRSPNGMKPSGESFLEQTQSMRLGVDVREATREPRGRKVRPTPLGAPPWARLGGLWPPQPSSAPSPSFVDVFWSKKNHCKVLFYLDSV